MLLKHTKIPLNGIIVIAGTGRCGTGWLHHWLLDHPDTYGPFLESNLFFNLARYATKEEGHGTFNCEKRVGISTRQYLKMTGKLAYQIITDPKANNNYRDGKDQIIPQACQIYEGKIRTTFVEKTPSNIQCTHEIYEMLSPYAPVYILHIYRDGRNFLESLIRQEWNWISWEDQTKRWINTMNQMISNNFPPNTLHIRYEDLVTNPPASEAISNHVRLPHISDIKPFEKLYSKGLPDFDPQRYNQLSDDPRIVQCYKKMIPTLKKLGYATE